MKESRGSKTTPPLFCLIADVTKNKAQRYPKHSINYHLLKLFHVKGSGYELNSIFQFLLTM